MRLKKPKLKYELEFDPAQDALGTKLHISSARELLIENHRGLIEYGPELILVATKGGNISVSGENLRAAAMNKGQILIKGKLSGIGFGGGNEL